MAKDGNSIAVVAKKNAAYVVIMFSNQNIYRKTFRTPCAGGDFWKRNISVKTGTKILANSFPKVRSESVFFQFAS